MLNLSYITQKIILHSRMDFHNVEDTAKVYFESLGFNVYKSTIAYNELYSGWGRQSIKNEELRKVLSDRTGIPDLLLLKDDSITFVEVKSSIDTLSQNQLEWIKEHPQFKVIVFGLEVEYDIPDRLEKLEKEIIELRQENKDLKKQIKEFDEKIERQQRWTRDDFVKKLRDFIFENE